MLSLADWVSHLKFVSASFSDGQQNFQSYLAYNKHKNNEYFGIYSNILVTTVLKFFETNLD